MNKVFRVELSGGNDRFCELDLPATNYELLDALERLQLNSGDKPEWEFIEHTDFHNLHVHLTGECDLYQLNALARRLEELDNSGKAAFEALFDTEVAKKYGPIRIATIIDLAYSTECCHVVEGVTTDEQLGQFYAENGFIPELKNLPDTVFQYLDFAKLGKKMRTEEGGALTRRGYVTQHTELKQVYNSLTLLPHKPDYIFRIHIARYPFSDNGQPHIFTPLELPATEHMLAQVLEVCGAASWQEVVFQVEDSVISGLLEEVDCEGIKQINALALSIQQLQEQGSIAKLKSILHVCNYRNISDVMEITEHLNDYLCTPGQRTYEEIAAEELRMTLDEPALSLLKKHVNLFNYGADLVKEWNAAITPYGVIERKDGQPIQTLVKPNMDMTM